MARDGLRKVCGCPRRAWAKCGHPWHFSFMWRGTRYRFSLDRQLKRTFKGRTDAAAAADEVRAQIRAGAFVAAVDEGPEVAQVVDPGPAVLTLAAFGAVWLERAVAPRGKVSIGNDASVLRRVGAFVPTRPEGAAPLGTWPITAITEDVIEAFMATLRAEGLAASTRNQYLQVWKALGRWGFRKGYLPRPWLDVGGDLKREKHAQRHRRLVPDRVDAHGRVVEPGEEARILAVAPVRLQRVIIAALETGCRLGELLSLQWADVSLARREIIIRGAKAKDGELRVLPMSGRLAAVLEMARTDLLGKAWPPEAYVFGDAVGRRLTEVRKAWVTAVLKAHGHTPVWTSTNGLGPASQAVWAGIDLHFHDLRHEAGSRWLEAGWPLHEIQAMLGHANLAQTSTYLNATRLGLAASMAKWDAARGFGKKVANERPVDGPPLCHPALDSTPQGLVS